MVQEVCEGDVKEQAMAFAQNLSENVSPVSMAAIKMQLWYEMQPNFVLCG